ncbi:efflux RND transporter periplasmic adaptor subunit [Candidatus Gracilibacteria bacterium]|nr:efflux RND transporter periplasmic adaptor subunit [Candidatus Gracilibacteria bacterium]
MCLFISKRFWFGIVLLGAVGFWYYQNTKPNLEEFDYIAVERGDFIQKVSVTGKVKPVDTTNLTFEQNGKIQEVLVEVGDIVHGGEMLVRLTNEELWAQKAEVLANLKEAQIILSEIKRGNRIEEISIERNKNKASYTETRNKQNTLKISIQEAFTDVQYIIKNTIARLTNNPSYDKAKLVFRTPYSIKLNDLNNQKEKLYRMLDSWERTIFSDEINGLYLLSLAEETENNLQQLKIFVDDLIEITPTLQSRDNSVQTKILDWQTNSSITQEKINQAISQVVQAKNNLISAQKSYLVSEDILFLAKKGSTEEQIARQEARVNVSEARVYQVQAQINKTILYAPFDGIITKVNAKEGEVISLISAKEILISMIGEKLEIELNVPEIDISKIAKGLKSEIRFDAFEDQVFQSQVKFIEPAETIVGGVVYYQVKVEIDPKMIPLDIRSGLSVEVDIITAERSQTLAIPQRMVIYRGGEKIVRVLRLKGANYEIVEVLVDTGIRDSEGRIEILKGLEEGDRLFIEKR